MVGHATSVHQSMSVRVSEDKQEQVALALSAAFVTALLKVHVGYMYRSLFMSRGPFSRGLLVLLCLAVLHFQRLEIPLG